MISIAIPFTRGPLTLPNRLAKSAMSERLAGRDGAPNEALVTLYEAWAKGGAGLLVTGNVVVQDERHQGELAAWASAARSGGAMVWAQINHPGRQAPRHINREAVAPSAVAMGGSHAFAFAKPRALASREIEAIIERFGRAAQVLVGAGFDGVQLHGAHGYLINQFLSPRTNRRDDAWGGDADRRMRFLLEVVRSVRSAVGKTVPVGVKLNSADFQRGGFTEEESMRVVSALEAEGVALLEVSGGTYESAAMFAEPRASTREREAFFLSYAERVRKTTSMPILLTGGFRSREGMDAALASGAIDVVGLARPLAAEPDLPARLLDGRATRAAQFELSTGRATLDSAIQAGWYQTQIRRVANGEAPSFTLGRLGALYRYVVPHPVRESTSGWSERRAQPTRAVETAGCEGGAAAA